MLGICISAIERLDEKVADEKKLQRQMNDGLCISSIGQSTIHSRTRHTQIFDGHIKVSSVLA